MGSKEESLFHGRRQVSHIQGIPSKHSHLQGTHLSTCPAGWIWWGEMKRHCLRSEEEEVVVTCLLQTQRFGASATAPESALPSSEEG